jgi:hypothetical protein
VLGEDRSRNVIGKPLRPLPVPRLELDKRQVPPTIKHVTRD